LVLLPPERGAVPRRKARVSRKYFLVSRRMGHRKVSPYDVFHRV
jgi:hypothetical protein